MSDDPFLRIGSFSTASSLTVKALRAYHESGLLVPAVVDPETGYRSYSVAQLTDAAVISRLRSLDMPLESIRAVLEARDPEVTRKMLAEHGDVLHDRMTSTQRAIDDLYVALDTPAMHTPVHLRHEPAYTVLLRDTKVTSAGWEDFLVQGRAVLEDAVQRSGAAASGAFGACYAAVLDEEGEDVQPYVPVAEAPMLPASVLATGVVVADLPATEVAVLVHTGSYEDLSDTYRKLGAWVGAHADPSGLPVHEIYLVGAHDTDNPDEYRTELCWPLRGGA